MKIISLYSILLLISCSSDNKKVDSILDTETFKKKPSTYMELMQTIQEDVFKYL